MSINLSPVVYYREYDFTSLKCGKSIKSHLGKMKKYLPHSIRIQFSKMKIQEILEDAMWVLEIVKKSEGYIFFNKLQEFNETKSFVKKDIKELNLFNNINRAGTENNYYTSIQMKTNDSTLFFNEKNEIIDLSYIIENKENIKVVCIASTVGVWMTEKTYGNTWIIDQVKVYNLR